MEKVVREVGCQTMIDFFLPCDMSAIRKSNDTGHYTRTCRVTKGFQ